MVLLMDILYFSVKEMNRVKTEINMLLSKVINRLLSKVISRLRKETNVLLSKGISTLRNEFLNLKNLSPGQFLGSSSSRRYH